MKDQRMDHDRNRIDHSDRSSGMDRSRHSTYSQASSGEYVAVYEMPSHAPRSRSRSSGSGEKSTRSGGEIYEHDEEEEDDVVMYTSLRDGHTPLHSDDNGELLHRQSSTDSIQLRGRHRPSQFSGAIRRESRLVHSKKTTPKLSLRDSVNKVMVVNRLGSLIRDADDDGDDTTSEKGMKEEHEKEICESNDRVAIEKDVLELWEEVADDMESGKKFTSFIYCCGSMYMIWALVLWQ